MRINVLPCVFDRYDNGLRCLADVNRYIAMVFGMTQCVRQQIAQCSAKHQSVAHDVSITELAQCDALFFSNGFVELQ